MISLAIRLNPYGSRACLWPYFISFSEAQPVWVVPSDYRSSDPSASGLAFGLFQPLSAFRLLLTASQEQGRCCRIFRRSPGWTDGMISYSSHSMSGISLRQVFLTCLRTSFLYLYHSISVHETPGHTRHLYSTPGTSRRQDRWARYSARQSGKLSILFPAFELSLGFKQ